MRPLNCWFSVFGLKISLNENMRYLCSPNWTGRYQMVPAATRGDSMSKNAETVTMVEAASCCGVVQLPGVKKM